MSGNPFCDLPQAYFDRLERHALHLWEYRNPSRDIAYGAGVRWDGAAIVLKRESAELTRLLDVVSPSDRERITAVLERAKGESDAAG